MHAKPILYALFTLVQVVKAAPALDRRWFWENWGTEKRSALVSVRNNSPQRMKCVSLVHKYSNVYKNKHYWADIARNELAPNQTTVEYNIGPLTIGRDWWQLSFYSDDMKTLYVTNPNNFRDVIDWFESIGSTVTIATAGASAGVLGTLAGPWTGAAASVAAVAVAKATTDQLFNSESTNGFKQHILRSEDANQLTEIVVNADYTVTFKSRSGDSRTVISAKAAPAIVPRDAAASPGA